MNKLLFGNTYKRGRMTYIAFKEGGKYIAVCLEFDLEVEAKSLDLAKEYIEDLSHAWLENVTKNKLPEELLNRPAPKKYWEMLALIKRVIEAKENMLLEKKRKAVEVSSHPLLSEFRSYRNGNSLAFA